MSSSVSFGGSSAGRLSRFPWRRPFARRMFAVLTAMTLMSAGLVAFASPPVVAAIPLSPSAAPLMGAFAADVPNPGPNEAIISVKVASDRTGGSTTGITTTGLPGVRLSLYAGTATTSSAQGALGARYDPMWSWTTCVSDADGDCNFRIPIRTGAPSATGVPENTRFWVAQAPSDAPPAGYYTNPVINVGQNNNPFDLAWAYRHRTGPTLAPGGVYLSTTPMTVSTQFGDPDAAFFRNRVSDLTGGIQYAQVNRSAGFWTQSRVNPELSTKCGLTVAVVVDTSFSLGATGIAQVKASLGTFVDAFAGTPTQASLFSFSTMSPGVSASNHPTLLPIGTSAGASAFKAQYAPWGALGTTNYEYAFAAVAATGIDYDLVVFYTDGNPTVRYANPPDTQSGFYDIGDIDAGIVSANTIKANGTTRIVAVGAGPGFTANGELNLRAVSGQTLGEDYYRVANFSAAGDVLADLARGNCEGSLVVNKMIVPSGGTIADAVPAPAGWEFAATPLSSDVTVTAPTTTTTDADGSVLFGLLYGAPATSGPVQVLETQQAGYELLPVGTGAAARNAVCVNADTGDPIAVTDAGGGDNPGFSLTTTTGVQAECTMYNRELPTEADLTVTKAWVVEGEPFDHGDQPAGLGAQLQLTGPALAGASDQGWGVTRTGYELDDVATITETATLSGDYAHCEVTAAVTQVNGAATNVALDATGAAGYDITLSQENNTAEVTNTVTCEQSLTLVKEVSFGDEPTESWTLTATAPVGALAGPSGTHSDATPVTAPVTAAVPYALAESGGPDTYVATGEWVCVLTEDGATAVPVTAAAVSVPRGQDVTCTVTNATATITLLKHVVDPLPGFEADAWDLTATPGELVGGSLATETVPGAETDGGASTFEVRPGHGYTLSEAATTPTLAYRLVGLERWDGTEWVPVTSAEIVAPAPGQNAIYRFVNDRIPAVMLPLTGGMGTHLFLMAGGVALALSLGLVGWTARRGRYMT